MNRKTTYIGGGGVRTPLVAFGVNEAAEAISARELVLYDPDPDRLHMMTELSQAVVSREGGDLKIRETSSIEDAVDGADFVMNSIRVGGMASRAADEIASIKHEFSGQETTGPAGVAMALRTVGISIQQAQLVERLSPDAWLINFTNPAGLITQAISSNTNAKVVGICDTPIELFHNIASAISARDNEVSCDYVGLNHLGWVRRVLLNGDDVTKRVLDDDTILKSIYSAPLFDPEMIRELQLIPTEYLYFYYERRRSIRNQRKQGSSRGSELEAMNRQLLKKIHACLQSADTEAAVSVYADYLNRRSGSYMRLEGEGGSAFDEEASFHVDPFRTATGYHRIAIAVMSALTGSHPADIVVNTPNRGAVPDLATGDIVETLSHISKDQIDPVPVDPLPDAVQGLVRAVKAYERAAIDAVLHGSRRTARRSMLIHPAMGEWEPSDALLSDLMLQGIFGNDCSDSVGGCPLPADRA